MPVLSAIYVGGTRYTELMAACAASMEHLWSLNMLIQLMYVLSRKNLVFPTPCSTSTTLGLLSYKEKRALSLRSSVACADCQY